MTSKITKYAFLCFYAPKMNILWKVQYQNVALRCSKQDRWWENLNFECPVGYSLRVGATPWWSSEQLGDWLGWKKRIWDYRWVFCHDRDTGDLNWWFESGETIKSDKCVCLCCILFAKQQNAASKFLKKAQQSCCRHGNKHTKIFMEFFLLLQTGPINAYSVATLQHWDLKGSISPRMSPFYF